ncbi:hypothetical protein M9458_019996, partial [Cirrhinus mrigala]
TVQILPQVWFWWVTPWVEWWQEHCSPWHVSIHAWSASSSPRPHPTRHLCCLWTLIYW